MKALKPLLVLSLLVLLNACATHKKQILNKKLFVKKSNISHTFYLIGDAGNTDLNKESKALSLFESFLRDADENSTAIFLGDNIYEKGMPSKDIKGRALAEHRIQTQIDAVKNFKGQAVFIPGNHDWYSGVAGLKRQEKFIENALGKNTFLPENGCPIEKIHITEKLELIIVDSHWYITDWDKDPTINDDCEIKTRDRFLDEFSSLIKKARGKTTIVAIHHPMFTNGSHGGQYSFKSHISPLPVLGSLKNLIRTTSGVSNADLSNTHYNDLKKRLVTLAQHNDKVVFVSGHDHNLQYLIEDGVHQIVSGSGSKQTPIRAKGSSMFGTSDKGFARLEIYSDGSSKVDFYSIDNGINSIYSSQVFPSDDMTGELNFSSEFPTEVAASIYSKKETQKSGFHRFLFGERFRELYSTDVKVPTVNLDTLFGGLKPIRKGGGNQSKSLRLEDKNGTQYVMRALRKSATQYLQAILFKDQYVEKEFDNTATEDLILDVFSGAHPYAPFIIGDLADAANVFHTNPTLYFIPKQNALGPYNNEFGDGLYMIEEHTSGGHSAKASFGFQDKLISTYDMIENIHKDEDLVLDEASYIRARLFDMLIGDWDRHQDQWRWIEFLENGKKVYRPMPRDRDQAFSKMADGFLLGAAVTFVPSAKLLRKYSNDLLDVKGVNFEPYPLDMELIHQSDKKIWDEQVKFIQEGITDEVIDRAFLNIPEEVRAFSIKEIKSKLQARRKNLQAISDRYYTLLNRYAVIKGTNKDDWFDIERLPDGETKVVAYRIKGGEKADKFHERIYQVDQTKEIWIYALDNDDVFRVFGSGDKPTKLRLVGGQNNDVYRIENGKRVTSYDYKSKPNTFESKKGKQKLTDNYKTNVYDFKKLKNNTNQFIPSIGLNPDDGFRIGFVDTYTTYGFERNPFAAQHKFKASYYFATNGFDFSYNGEFANIFDDVNLSFEAQFNSPNYAVNFFGFGNETINPEADESDGLDVDLDFNRVKIRTLKFVPSLIWRGHNNSLVRASISYESNKVEQTEGRFIATLPEEDPVFDSQDFYGAELSYSFENQDDKVYPTVGMNFLITAGYKNNIVTEKGFGYLIPELGFNYKLEPSGHLVLATKFLGHVNLGNNFEFYQGATLGDNQGLRAYRFQRFTGKSAFAHSTDIRWNFSDFKTGVLPISIGVFGGIDYGRVWVDNDDSDRWNNALGGGIFVNFVNLMTGNVSAFSGSDGWRFAFKLGFGF